MPPRRAKKRTATEAAEVSEQKKIAGNGDVSKKTRGKRARKADEEVECAEDEVPVAVVGTEEVVQKKSKTTKSLKKNDVIGRNEVIVTHKTPSSSADYAKKGSWKIVSMNVNGIRSWLPKGGLEYIEKEDADVFCVQETKCSEDKLPPELSTIDGYESYFLAGDKEGYSGVGVLTKKKPLKVSYGIGVEEHDSEGRVITLEFDKFFVVNSYVPNAGRGLVRLDYRQSWDKDFRKYLVGLKQKKGVILTGDLNVAHNEIDLKNPKTNRKNAGFTDEERQGLTDLLKEGFVDSFRKLYPETEGAYTFWTYMRNARANNVGWRLDYFIVSENLIDDVIDNEIRSEIMGSDHCPIVLHLE